jgi:hypothetical protein
VSHTLTNLEKERYINIFLGKLLAHETKCIILFVIYLIIYERKRWERIELGLKLEYNLRTYNKTNKITSVAAWGRG